MPGGCHPVQQGCPRVDQDGSGSVHRFHTDRGRMVDSGALQARPACGRRAGPAVARYTERFPVVPGPLGGRRLQVAGRCSMHRALARHPWRSARGVRPETGRVCVEAADRSEMLGRSSTRCRTTADAAQRCRVGLGADGPDGSMDQSRRTRPGCVRGRSPVESPCRHGRLFTIRERRHGRCGAGAARPDLSLTILPRAKQSCTPGRASRPRTVPTAVISFADRGKRLTSGNRYDRTAAREAASRRGPDTQDPGPCGPGPWMP